VNGSIPNLSVQAECVSRAPADTRIAFLRLFAGSGWPGFAKDSAWQLAPGFERSAYTISAPPKNSKGLFFRASILAFAGGTLELIVNLCWLAWPKFWRGNGRHGRVVPVDSLRFSWKRNISTVVSPLADYFTR